MTDKEWTEIYNQFYLSVSKPLRSLDQEDERMRALNCELTNRCLIQWYEHVLTEAQHQYYLEGSEFMSDLTYDRFERGLKALRPDSEVLKRVGYKCSPAVVKWVDEDNEPQVQNFPINKFEGLI